MAICYYLLADVYPFVSLDCKEFAIYLANQMCRWDGKQVAVHSLSGLVNNKGIIFVTYWEQWL